MKLYCLTKAPKEYKKETLEELEYLLGQQRELSNISISTLRAELDLVDEKITEAYKLVHSYGSEKLTERVNKLSKQLSEEDLFLVTDFYGWKAVVNLKLLDDGNYGLDIKYAVPVAS